MQILEQLGNSNVILLEFRMALWLSLFQSAKTLMVHAMWKKLLRLILMYLCFQKLRKMPNVLFQMPNGVCWLKLKISFQTEREIDQEICRCHLLLPIYCILSIRRAFVGIWLKTTKLANYLFRSFHRGAKCHFLVQEVLSAGIAWKTYSKALRCFIVYLTTGVFAVIEICLSKMVLQALIQTSFDVL